MMVPQPTAQYGHVERVSLARSIFNWRSCANAGFRSNPKTAAAVPPTAPIFRKSRRVEAIVPPCQSGESHAQDSTNSLLCNGLQAEVCHCTVTVQTPYIKVLRIVAWFRYFWVSDAIWTDFYESPTAASALDDGDIGTS